jgi:hypothetical protein
MLFAQLRILHLVKLFGSNVEVNKVSAFEFFLFGIHEYVSVELQLYHSMKLRAQISWQNGILFNYQVKVLRIPLLCLCELKITDLYQYY